MTTSEKKYHKKEIAIAQLKTAVWLFLNNKDLSSVITLASASGNILSQLVRNAGKEPFIDYACSIYNHFNGNTPGRAKYNHFMDKALGIIPHKHMGKSCPETIELDLLRCAVDGLARTITDYVTLYGQEEPFVKAFLTWTWHNASGKKLMEELKDVPKNLLRIKEKNAQRNTQTP